MPSFVYRNKVNMTSIVIHSSKNMMEVNGGNNKYQNYPNLGVEVRSIAVRNRILKKTTCCGDYSVTATSAVAPSEPRNLSLVLNTDEEITISYDEPLTGNVTQYLITYTPDEGSSVTINNGQSTTITITGLLSNTQYTITVVASNGYGSSSNSNILTVTTDNLDVFVPKTFTTRLTETILL